MRVPQRGRTPISIDNIDLSAFLIASGRRPATRRMDGDTLVADFEDDDAGEVPRLIAMWEGGSPGTALLRRYVWARESERRTLSLLRRGRR